MIRRATLPMLAVLLAGGAFAADLPRREAPTPPIPPAFTWTGFSVGANAGYGFRGGASTYTDAVSAQDLAVVRAPTVEVPASPAAPDLGKGLPKGALVFHGNYCGPGSRGDGLPPVDALDRACMHHDACSPPAGQGLPSCACNDRLEREAALVARTPRIRDDLRTTAEFVSVGAKALACEP